MKKGCLSGVLLASNLLVAAISLGEKYDLTEYIFAGGTHKYHSLALDTESLEFVISNDRGEFFVPVEETSFSHYGVDDVLNYSECNGRFSIKFDIVGVPFDLAAAAVLVKGGAGGREDAHKAADKIGSAVGAGTGAVIGGAVGSAVGGTAGGAAGAAVGGATKDVVGKDIGESVAQQLKDHGDYLRGDKVKPEVAEAPELRGKYRDSDGNWETRGGNDCVVQ
ncbi:MAG: hypothetical protein OXT67_05530 [Zetaproteobacteria bacterium]|nr:hypothetical protein [Zetaproteobacteria bacterium]